MALSMLQFPSGAQEGHRQNQIILWYSDYKRKCNMNFCNSINTLDEGNRISEILSYAMYMYIYIVLKYMKISEHSLKLN